MIEVVGNLWTYAADFRAITTNGTVKFDGRAVMGRGCAREATQRYPKIARQLGYRKILTYTLPSEGGASLRGAGWMDEGEAGGGLGGPPGPEAR